MRIYLSNGYYCKTDDTKAVLAVYKVLKAIVTTQTKRDYWKPLVKMRQLRVSLFNDDKTARVMICRSLRTC